MHEGFGFGSGFGFGFGFGIKGFQHSVIFKFALIVEPLVLFILIIPLDSFRLTDFSLQVITDYF